MNRTLEGPMSHAVRRRLVLGAILVALALAAVLYVAFRGSPVPGAGSGSGGARLGTSTGGFTIAGDADQPITPGVEALIDLEFTNPHGFALVVTDVGVTVRDLRAPGADAIHGCAIGDFFVDQAPSPLEITLPPDSTSTLRTLGVARASWPRVGLRERPVNQDGCKGASLTLAYTASGIRDS